MPPDSPQNRSALPRSRVVEVIARSTDDALRQLRQAGVPETEALAVIRRFNAFAVQVLRELDHLYREFKELLAEDPERSADHQEWLETKLGGMQLTIEAFIAALVAETINKVKEDYRTAISRPREVITLPAKPSRPGWVSILLAMTNLFVWVAGMVSGFALAWQTSGSYVVAALGFLVTFALWLMCGRHWWGLIFPLTGLGLEAWVLYWLFIVEGGY